MPAHGLIVLLNGWAMTPESIEHLIRPQGYDLLVLWDYREPLTETDLQPMCPWAQYRDVHLVAWSMGVWAADRLSSFWRQLPLSHAIAICGTGYPMHDSYGIPVEIFRGTLEGLTEANRARFNRRMCGGRTYRHLFDALAQRTTEEIRTELEDVMRYELAREHAEVPTHRPLGWTLALIGGQDRIIPADNQVHYWQSVGTSYKLYPEAAHYLLGELTHWSDLWTEA